MSPTSSSIPTPPVGTSQDDGVLRIYRLVLVDDHALLRESLAARLDAEPDFNVVGAVDNAEAALELAQRLEPDMLLLDIDLPGLDCFDAASRLHRLMPQLRIVFLSAHCSDHYIEQALAVDCASDSSPGEALLVR